METIKETLASIKKTKGLRSKIHKELGLHKAITDIQAEDMYEFEYKRPEYTTRNWILLHGKCIEAGQKDLIQWGYDLMQTGHISKDDTRRSGSLCAHCGELLDKTSREKYILERNAKLTRNHIEYLEEKEIREEWEAEQILLGKR